MKNKEDLAKSFELLDFYIKEFEAGKTIVYLPMAVELRKLLCEKDPSPLIERLTPDFKLYRLHFSEIIKNTPSLLNGLENFMPGSLSVLGNGATIFHLTFSKSKEKMATNDWVDQPFFKENITIKELIKSVADKEAAHADVNYNETLAHCQNWSYNNINCRILGIYAIAQFVNALFVNEYGHVLK